MEFEKPVLADEIKLAITPNKNPNETPVVKNVVVEACIKGNYCCCAFITIKSTQLSLINCSGKPDKIITTTYKCIQSYKFHISFIHMY